MYPGLGPGGYTLKCTHWQAASLGRASQAAPTSLLLGEQQVHGSTLPVCPLTPRPGARAIPASAFLASDLAFTSEGISKGSIPIVQVPVQCSKPLY